MDKYVTRQPIKALKEDRIVGYEVLFQKDYNSIYSNSDVAVADTIRTFSCRIPITLRMISSLL